ncbi:MAG: nucleotidyltransferase [Gracilibacteraceae bacterium]|nr:nucleotidyltransferase [Gracilibacteraceae bacterium]
MKTVGIISEYNPFHNGHKHHIQAAKEACGAKHTVCIMSGNFVQRGEPSIFDKWTRSQIAVMNGADLVIELPVIYACQPAEIFAAGAVKILNSLGVIDYICFGSELGDTNTLHRLAELLQNEPEAFRLLLKKQLEQGVSYPKAVSDALSQYAGKDIPPDADDILKNPNNVLGVEYIKALMALKSSIVPVAVKRIGSSHNDTGITGYIASATAIRNEIKNSGISNKVKMSLPENSIDIIDKNLKRNKHPVFMNDFSDILLYKLRTMEKTELIRYPGVKEGIENRLKKCADTSSSCEGLIEAVKTKRYTRTYIQRLLCHVLLDIKNSDVSMFKSPDCPCYIRVLAFNNSGKRLIKSIMDRCPYPVISKVADFKCADNRISRMFAYDVQATNIYNLAYRTLEFRKGSEDYLTSPYYHRE